jgi:hypothetical protein
MRSIISIFTTFAITALLALNAYAAKGKYSLFFATMFSLSAPLHLAFDFGQVISSQPLLAPCNHFS